MWATRTGRWRIGLKHDREGPLADRLYRLICGDIREGLLPPGAIMPSPGRVAIELGVDAAAVEEAYSKLLAEGLVEQSPGRGPRITSPQGAARDVGSETQIRFEKNLLDTARRAAAEGVSARDASGIFRRPPIEEPGS